MRAVIQRVTHAAVTVDNKIISEISSGLLILIGIEVADDKDDINWLTKKISQLRIFDDKNGVMNKSLIETKGEAMVISQFTLHAKTKKGNRPSYIKAARPETAIPLYHEFISSLKSTINQEVKTGKFGAMMQVELVNSGPITIIIDTKNKE